MFIIRQNGRDNTGNVVSELEYLYHITPKENIESILSNGIIRQIGYNRKRCCNDYCEDDRVFATNFRNISKWTKTLGYKPNEVAVFQIKQNELNPYMYSWFCYGCENEVSIHNRDVEVNDIKLFMVEDEIVDSFERKGEYE